jgi:NAD(P)-dependent dehydrogenase (short-subunit alcohol dehydrogenase family)
MKDFTGRVAAITGAGSGIGRALAVQLADEGAHLALCDVDERSLDETVALCEGRSVKLTSARVDVAERAAVFGWADQVVADHGRVNLVFNNAGVALAYTVDAMSMDDLEWLMGVNFYGVAYGTKAFLPYLVASGEGHVVNVSSVFGFVGIPGQSAYNASKFAVRGFTDALRLELKSAGVPVSCTTVHPGGVKTNIVANARLDPDWLSELGDRDPGAVFRRTARTTPETAAASILAAVRRDKRRVVIGPDAKAFDLLGRMPAALYHWPIIGTGRIANRRRRRIGRHPSGEQV